MDLDLTLLYFINHLPHPGALDLLMLFVSKLVTPLWVGFVAVLFILAFKGKKDFREVVFLVLAFGLGFLILVIGGKEIFARPRPFMVLEKVILVDKTETDFSFPSGHAFSIALLLVLISRKKDKLMTFFIPATLLVGFSRVYLGVHYPSDVFVGLGLGFLYGLGVNAVVDSWTQHKIFKILKFHIE